MHTMHLNGDVFVKSLLIGITQIGWKKMRELICYYQRITAITII